MINLSETLLTTALTLTFTHRSLQIPPFTSESTTKANHPADTLWQIGRSGPSSAVLPKAGSLQPRQRRTFQPGRWGGLTYPHANAPKLSRRFGRFSGSPDSRLRLAPTVYLSQTGPGLLGRRPSGRRRRARASPLCRRITKRAEGRQPGLRNRRWPAAVPSPGADWAARHPPCGT